MQILILLSEFCLLISAIPDGIRAIRDWVRKRRRP